MFTRDKLDKLDSGTIFASGIDFDGNDGIHLCNTGELLRWVAVRGGVDDWAVYADKARNSAESVRDFGCKLSKREALKLVMGSEDFYNRYRS